MNPEGQIRFTLRMGESLYRALEREAKSRKGASINSLVRDIVKQSMCTACGEEVASFCAECMVDAHRLGRESIQISSKEEIVE